MKESISKLIFVFSGLSLSLCNSYSVVAQQTAIATANISATIVAPITITTSAVMDFGEVAVSTVNGGSVVIAPGGTLSSSGGVNSLAGAGAATFSVNGQGGYTYSINLPEGETVIDAGSSGTIVISGFTSDPSSIGTLSANNQSVSVGATLTVPKAEASGVYVASVPFIVNVSYN